MQEYGFWPENLPTPYEKQKDETLEQFNKRQSLQQEYDKIGNDIAELYNEKEEINIKLLELKKEYKDTWNIDKIRKDIAKKVMEESKDRRNERRKQQQLLKKEKSESWQKKKSEEIVFIGKGYSDLLNDKEIEDDKLIQQGLPLIKTDKDLAEFLCIEYKQLRFLTYHRDVVSTDHYHRYTVPKRKGGVRNIAAPKAVLKAVQRKILEEILCKLSVSEKAHGFLKGKSVVTGAKVHEGQTSLLINMDLENFFPTITFERVRGMFKGFGYSGYISSLLAMLCTYCDRMAIEVKGETKYVKTSHRILPQGSPASPMITNILCRKMDIRLNGLAEKTGFIYTRYADDISFSLKKTSFEEAFGMNFSDQDSNDINLGKFCGLISIIVKEEGFNINNEKTRFLRKNNRQCVTGIVINNKEAGLPRKWIRNLRAAIYNANKLKTSCNLSIEVKNEISGMASWAKSVNEKRYKDIIDRAFEVIK